MYIKGLNSLFWHVSIQLSQHHSFKNLSFTVRCVWYTHVVPETWKAVTEESLEFKTILGTYQDCLKKFGQAE
jgi:hypothetical protein